MSEVDLRDYVERIFDEREKFLQARLDASRREVDQAASALHSRLESMNEFRAQIQQERALYVRTIDLTPLEERLRRMETVQAKAIGALALLTVLLNLALKLWKGP